MPGSNRILNFNIKLKYFHNNKESCQLDKLSNRIDIVWREFVESFRYFLRGAPMQGG